MFDLMGDLPTKNHQTGSFFWKLPEFARKNALIVYFNVIFIGHFCT
jgi:hypothetical protein